MSAPLPAAPFRVTEGGRTIVFGRGAAAEAPGLLDEPYVLLTTPRAQGAAEAQAVAAAAAATVLVPSGLVEVVAEALFPAMRARPERLWVALGGGRVVDVAKAMAALAGGRRVAAIPTTLSAAEMTRSHRQIAGAPAGTPGIRPEIVINDPALSASQPATDQAGSAANSLGHAVEALVTVRASPLSSLPALEAVRLIAAAAASDAGAGDDVAGDTDAVNERADRYALAALLSGYALDLTGLGLHHVLAQSIVRAAGVSHGAANAAMLPHTTAALRMRRPEMLAAADDAAGQAAERLAAELARRAGAASLGALGVTAAQLEAATAAAAARPQLAATPPAAAADEIAAIYAAAARG